VPLKEDREAVLSYLDCGDARLFMLEFIADTLRGMLTTTSHKPDIHEAEG
jgi:hypothetical protein